MKLFYPVNENDLNSEILPKVMKGSEKLWFLSVCFKPKSQLRIHGKPGLPLQRAGSALLHSWPSCCLWGTAAPTLEGPPPGPQ